MTSDRAEELAHAACMPTPLAQDWLSGLEGRVAAAIRQARDEALEEAAMVAEADTATDHDDGFWIAREIRALKSSGGSEGEASTRRHSPRSSG